VPHGQRTAQTQGAIPERDAVCCIDLLLYNALGVLALGAKRPSFAAAALFFSSVAALTHRGNIPTCSSRQVLRASEPSHVSNAGVTCHMRLSREGRLPVSPARDMLERGCCLAGSCSCLHRSQAAFRRSRCGTRPGEGGTAEARKAQERSWVRLVGHAILEGWDGRLQKDSGTERRRHRAISESAPTGDPNLGHRVAMHGAVSRPHNPFLLWFTPWAA
jgi:hypothetical protein